MRVRHRSPRRSHRLSGQLNPPRRGVFVVRLIAALAVCAVGLILFTLLSAPSARKLITEDLSARLDKLESADSDIMDRIESASAERFKTIGVDSTEFAKAYLADFDYRIGDIDIDGDNATAKVTVTTRRLSSVLSAFSTDYQREVRSLDQAPDPEQSATLAGKSLLQAAKDTEPEDHVLTIAYHHDAGGGWQMQDSSWRNELSSALGAQGKSA